jgi:hypothetical protein
VEVARVAAANVQPSVPMATRPVLISMDVLPVLTAATALAQLSRPILKTVEAVAIRARFPPTQSRPVSMLRVGSFAIPVFSSVGKNVVLQDQPVAAPSVRI